MPSCCYGDEYDHIFTAREAARDVRRYRQRGLKGSAARLVARVGEVGVEGRTVLEVGGGAGAIHVELLRAGATHATNVELADVWTEAAHDLAAGLGLADRIDRRIADIVDEADTLPTADVVILHRVVCCYPDWPAMLEAASSKAGRVLAFTFPRAWFGPRWLAAAGNALLRWRGRTFQVYLHPPEPMIESLRQAGFDVRADDRDLIWRTVVAERTA